LQLSYTFLCRAVQHVANKQDKDPRSVGDRFGCSRIRDDRGAPEEKACCEFGSEVANQPSGAIQSTTTHTSDSCCFRLTFQLELGAELQQDTELILAKVRLSVHIFDITNFDHQLMLNVIFIYALAMN